MPPVERFRYAGTNWEGRKWYVSAPVAELGRALSREWPEGNTALDGTVASEKHDANNPNSDHRPRPHTGTGIVRALDFWVPNRATGDLLAAIIDADPRVSYVLWQVKDHTKHVHVSMKWASDNDGRRWELFNQHEIIELKRIVAGLDAVDSNGGFVVQCVEDIREKNGVGGHYAAADHGPHGGGTAGLGYGDKVTLARP